MGLVNKKQQSGAVLVVSLILLVSLTIIVLSVNQGVVVQERITSSVRESNQVFHTAENALIEAEAFVDSMVNLEDFSDSGVNGLYTQNNGPDDYTDSSVWAPGVSRTATTVLDGYEAQYIVEDVGEFNILDEAQNISLQNDYVQPDQPTVANVFRIIVRSVGPNGVSEKYVLSYYSSNLLMGL